MMRSLRLAVALCVVGRCVCVHAESMTLAQAEEQALRNQPQLAAAELRARASGQRTREARSGYMPTVAFNATGALVADTGSATAAGALTTSSVSDRFAYGGSLVQMVTDFGRTPALVRSARFEEISQRDVATYTRAEIRLAVRQSYYDVLASEAVLRAAQQALDNRRLISRQVSALTQSQLRSTLDLHFAQVLESQAELAVVQAQSIVAQRRSALATAIGENAPVAATLIDPSQPSPLPPDATTLLPDALQNRADLQASQALFSSATQFAKAEQRLSLPTLNVLGAAGQLPYHDHTLRDDYAAAGFNLNIPIFNGNLFAARHSEAALEAQARSKDLQQKTLEVNQQVRDAWYQADESYRSLDVSERLLQQSEEALRLAQARYDAGLGSIVELNEAQLNDTSALIGLAQAKYTYLSRRTLLDFASGALN
ncbi:MAG TPA: TolC family protein [Granulicella sp.]